MFFVAMLFSCTITSEEFSTELFDLQCLMETCHQPDDGCSAQQIQPRIDCDFNSSKAKKCLQAVEALIAEHADMFIYEDDYGYCTCIDSEWIGDTEGRLDYTSEECTSMPESSDLPAECDSVCNDI